jgi:hypothetical protein
VLKNVLPPQGRRISVYVIWGNIQYMERGNKKKENLKDKGKKVK